MQFKLQYLPTNMEYNELFKGKYNFNLNKSAYRAFMVLVFNEHIQH